MAQHEIPIGIGQSEYGRFLPDSQLKLGAKADADSDGYGDANVSVLACSQPDGYIEDGTDCDDMFATVYVGAPELCDNLDNDCDGEVDGF